MGMFLRALTLLTLSCLVEAKQKDFYTFKVVNSRGRLVSLDKYRGSVSLQKWALMLQTWDATNVHVRKACDTNVTSLCGFLRMHACFNTVVEFPHFKYFLSNKLLTCSLEWFFIHSQCLRGSFMHLSSCCDSLLITPAFPNNFQ